jgi:hypothetical protein
MSPNPVALRRVSRDKFDEAVKRFVGMLGAEGCGERIVWVWPEDVLVTGKRVVYVRMPVAERNEIRARKMYDEVMRLDCGLRMKDVCVGQDVTYCTLWGRPEEHAKEPQLWPGRGLMMSVTEESSRVVARPVRSEMRWRFLRWWYRERQGMKEVLFS